MEQVLNQKHWSHSSGLSPLTWTVDLHTNKQQRGTGVLQFWRHVNQPTPHPHSIFYMCVYNCSTNKTVGASSCGFKATWNTQRASLFLQLRDSLPESNAITRQAKFRDYYRTHSCYKSKQNKKFEMSFYFLMETVRMAAIKHLTASI